MSSPKSEKICNGSKDIPRNTCFSSESSAAQGSLSSGDINNLSPVQPLKDAAILQGIPGITSPPNLFTSPRFKPQSSILNRQQQCHTSSSEYPQATVGLDKTNAIVDDQGSNISPVDEEFLDTGSREHLDATSKLLGSAAVKKDSIKDNCLSSGISRLLFKRADESSIGGIVSNVCQMEDESHQFVARSEVCSDVISKAFTEQDCKESLHKVNHGQGGVLRQSFDFGEHQLKSIRESSDDTSVGQMDVSVASKPRGIGLHLNSIVAGQQGNLVIGKQSSKGMVKLQRKSLIISGSIDTHTISSNTFEKISPISKADLDLNEPVEMATPNEYLLTGTAKSLDFPVPLSPALEELAESSGESNQAGSNTKTKQASNFDGCKRCSCKKSKCLKLYCDCFAAGLYCIDSCSCQGCFNRPEHKESVIEARQLIESRNPLAFAPRVMQHVANSPTNSGESSEPVAQTPLRHKRGCNCRKSMCLKKYCECYEANVGCSDACRCEGCKNANGKKPDYDARIHTPQKRTSEEALDQKHKLLITRRNHFSIDEGKDFPVAVPCTPAIVCSDLRKNEMKSLRPGRRYVLSPDPNLNTPPSAKQQSSSSSSRSSMFNLCHFTTRLTNPNPNPNPPMEEPLPEYLTSNVCIEDHEAMHNDTPMILRHSSAPVKSVKVGSPNNKRVSPPHNHHLDELPVRSSRKFIFRSVPKLPPPLSPCCDSNNPSDNLADAY